MNTTTNPMLLGSFSRAAAARLCCLDRLERGACSAMEKSFKMQRPWRVPAKNLLHHGIWPLREINLHLPVRALGGRSL